MKWSILVTALIALSVLRPAQPPRPSAVCVEVVAVATMLEGQSYGLTCGSGARLTVTPTRRGQPAPSLGRATVTAGTLWDNAREGYGVVTP